MMQTLPTTADLDALQPERNDEQLMQAIIDREQKALDQLYARYRPLDQQDRHGNPAQRG